MVVVVHPYSLVFSKDKRKLEKKPPKRSSICTTPRYLMKKKGKVPRKGEKQAESGEQQGENGPQTSTQKLKDRKSTKKLKKRNTTQKEEGTKKTGSNTGAKIKR